MSHDRGWGAQRSRSDARPLNPTPTRRHYINAEAKLRFIALEMPAQSDRSAA